MVHDKLIVVMSIGDVFISTYLKFNNSNVKLQTKNIEYIMKIL
jgi:hypothetical protein